MCSYDKYELAEKQLKSFTRSKIRTKVLLCLKDADKNVGELEQEIGSRNTTILHAIKDMSEADLITRSSKGYHLTNLGQMQAYLLNDLMGFAQVLEEHRDFWLNHDISGIPQDLLTNIGMLAQSEIISPDSSAPLKSQEHFVSELVKANEIHGVSPIIAPGYAEAIAIPVKNGATVELILTEAVLKIVNKEHNKIVDDLLAYDNFKLYRINEDVKVAFTVTDVLLALGLRYRLDGNYDLGSDLICEGGGAVMWGLKLFKYYQNNSEMMTKL